jgi:hypothetical protein
VAQVSLFMHYRYFLTMHQSSHKWEVKICISHPPWFRPGVGGRSLLHSLVILLNFLLLRLSRSFRLYALLFPSPMTKGGCALSTYLIDN